jgi:uncharacterized repeat protein (TIGR02543 family)
MALKADGTVWAWGDNEDGQLGDGTTIDRHTPVQVLDLNGVTAVSAGWDYSLALKGDGSVWAWGLNEDGQLGDGTSSIFQLTPVQVSGLKAQFYIAVNSAHDVPTASAWIDPGGSLTVMVTSPTPDNGTGTRYVCTGYTLDGNAPVTDGSTSYAFENIQSAHTITFNWIAQYYLTVTSDYGDPRGGGWYDVDSMATFSVTSPVGTLVQQVFVGWSGDSTETTTPGTLTMDGPKTVTANWRTDYVQIIIIALIVIAAVIIALIGLRKRQK